MRPKALLDAEAVERTLSRIAHELIERNADLDALALVGIQPAACRLPTACVRSSRSASGVEVDIGAVDITFHRDDVLVRGGGPPLHPQPVVRGTELDFPLEGKTVVLVDDVLFSGRTIRAAIDALLEYGRPARVQLAVLVDRGHRELPIRPDYVGKNIPTALAERVQVELGEIDDGDRVVLLGARSAMTETVQLAPRPSCRRATLDAARRHLLGDLRSRPRRHRAPARHRRHASRARSTAR